MREIDPFRELLESLEEESWPEIEEEEPDDEGGGGGGRDGRRFGGGRGGGEHGRGQGGGRLLWFILLPFLVLIFFNWGLGFFTDWLWYKSLDLDSVFFTRITASVGLFLAGGILFWIILAVNVLIARRLEPHGLVNTPLSELADIIGMRLTTGILLFGALFAFFMGSAASSAWEEVLLYFNQTSFQVTEPIFGRDVGFYIFTLPVWQLARNWLMVTLVITLIATALVTGLGWRSWRASSAVRAHLSGLGALILLLVAWQYRLDAFQLVYSTRGAVFGAGYTDVNAQLPAYNLLTLVTLIAAVLLLVNVVMRQAWRAIVIVLVVWVAVAVIAGNIYPGIVQRFQVSPNEYVREAPFIQNNIQFTRQAYDLDSVRSRDYEVANLTAEDLLSQPETIRNIRLWDYRPLLQTYNQIQALRQYYEFRDIDVDRYALEDGLRQVMLGARELVPEQLNVEAQTWVNRKLVYTHGYGVAVSPVARVTQDGLPDFLVKDIPPQGKIPITKPQIYFGEKTNDYVIVRTSVDEFDYPQGGGNVFTTFEAETGIPIGSYLSRLLFALRFGDFNILLTDAIQPTSRLLWKRNIMERAQEVAPFLRFDGDPYIVIGEDGKLYWILDAFTTSNRYPYSTPINSRQNPLLPRWRLNYIRNSVKIVTDAYTGEMRFYVVDPSEPIIAAYNRIFPALFTPLEEMPPDLLAHIRYPNSLFIIQAEIFRTYHMTDTREFYNREDLWEWPEEVFQGEAILMEPYYVLMELPGEKELEFIQILPFTPANRENMIAWLAAQSAPEKYGEKLLFQFGKDSLVYGPKQIEARIDQDPVISAQLSLWNQQGSQVIRGNLLVIPIGDSLLYVEPLYLQAANGKIPELKRVIVATTERVVMDENLGLALAQLFGPDVLSEEALAELLAPGTQIPTEITPPTGPAPALTLEDLILQANERYARAQERIRQGDWAGYGAEMEALQQILEQLAEQAGVVTPEPTPAPQEGSEAAPSEGPAETPTPESGG